MSFQAQLVMILWIPIVFYLFKRFSPYQAIINSFIIAWLFLPQNAGFSFVDLPEYDRISATCLGVILCIFTFKIKPPQNFKLSWIDIPIIIYTISPFFSSLSNGLGIYDGLSSTSVRIIQYAVPYFIGRIYLSKIKILSTFTKSILISGLIYVPLCLIEIRLSPQIHKWVYGYAGIRQFAQGIRYGGYRPSVFMRHGLSVGMWMMAVTLIAFWLWQSKAVKKIWGIPIELVIIVLLVTFILIKSTGAYGYLIFGLVILFCAKTVRFSLPLLGLSLAVCLYLLVGATGQLTQSRLNAITSTLSRFAPPDRVDSLIFRFENEYPLARKALSKPMFGWGGWGRNRIFITTNQGERIDTSVTDSLWIITYGINGAFGLIGVFSVMLVPPIYFFFKYSPKLWFKTGIDSIAVLNVILVLYSVDCTMNNQFNPVFIVISGAVSGCLTNTTPQNILKPKKRKVMRTIKQISA